MVAKDPKHVAFVSSTNTIYNIWHRVCTDPLMSWDEKMQALQWVYKKIPQLNRIAMEIKTKEVNLGK